MKFSGSQSQRIRSAGYNGDYAAEQFARDNNLGTDPNVPTWLAELNAVRSEEESDQALSTDSLEPKHYRQAMKTDT